MPKPRLRCLSLFVPNLEAAAKSYAEVFGLQPADTTDGALDPHPYADRPPVVFDFGGVKLALYQAEGRSTHAGDVGLVIETDETTDAVVERATKNGAAVMMRPTTRPRDKESSLAVFMLPDRHFVELLGKTNEKN